MSKKQIISAVVLLISFSASPLFGQSQTTPIAQNGDALLPIVIAKDASERIQDAADNLAKHLGQITNAPFKIVTGDGREGIAIGLPTHFPKLAAKDLCQTADLTQREDYLLHSHAKGVHILGATELAVEHAVWDLLYRIGYRQFFPGKTWEVIPKIRDLSIQVNVKESPDYCSRRIWYGFGLWGYNNEAYADWCAKNRAVSGIGLSTGHSYVGIIRGNQKEFDAHPEYYALVKGKRNISPLAQLCISNPGLRKLVIQHALNYFQRNPDADSISMDPNDGGGHCECEHCAKMGSISDRVLTLANEVAEAVNKKYGSKLVGIYAYASHSPPPTIRVHPKVIVSVATAFIRGGYSIDELIDGWSKQGATLGIREYYSVHTWDRDLPSKARGSNLDYLKKTIPYFHSKGARFMSAESSDNWGCNGLGYYFAARMLWDVDEAKRSQEIIDDFLSRAFGPAQKPMREFYHLIDGSEKPLIVEDQIGRMFRTLSKAKKLANSPEILARIHDLVLYAHYVALFHKYQAASGKERQAAFERLIRHGYRMRKTMMIHAKGLYRDVDRRDKTISTPDNAQWGVAEGKNPWKSSEPFSEEELASFVKEGIRNHPLAKRDFEFVTFRENLVPAAKLKLSSKKRGTTVRGRGTQVFYTWIDKSSLQLKLKITGGLIAHYRDRGNVKVQIWTTGDDEKLVAEDRSVPPDGKERTVTLKVDDPGFYKVTISDGGDMTKVDWPAGTPVCLKSSLKEGVKIVGRWSLYFYVPKGTKVIGLFGSKNGYVLNPAGKKVFDFSGRKPGYYSVPVPKGQDGKLWMISNASDSIRLLTVPPYLARVAEELLLPANVVNADEESQTPK